MPNITLYLMPGSPPCRAVELVSNQLGLKPNVKIISTTKGEHLKEEYLRLNPQHTLPTMKDGNFVLWESRAIMTYLISAYGKDDSLYPADPKSRAAINRLLFFDLDTLYKRFTDYLFPILFGGESSFDKTKKEKLIEALDFLETFLSGHKFAASDNISVADYALIVTVTTIKAVELFDLTKYKKINEWIENCSKEIKDFEEVNNKSAEMFAHFTKGKLTELKL